jgi:hypothetical protein
VSLYATAGIRTRDTIAIPVFVNGQRLEALVDTGSSHTFVDMAVARRIKLESELTNLRVTVANGDKVPCAAVARGHSDARRARRVPHHLLQHRPRQFQLGARR